MNLNGLTFPVCCSSSTGSDLGQSLEYRTSSSVGCDICSRSSEFRPSGNSRGVVLMSKFGYWLCLNKNNTLAFCPGLCLDRRLEGQSRIRVACRAGPRDLSSVGADRQEASAAWLPAP